MRAAAILALAAVLGGCAASEKPQGVAGPVRQAPAMAKVEIEDDGLPSQLAPRQPHFIPDEPSEPWSPNYGAARKQAAVPIPAPAAPPPAVAATARPGAVPFTLARSETPMDPDEVIRRAIAEHEMRQR